MSVYKITATTNTEEYPFVLGKGAKFSGITSVDFKECFVNSPKFSNQTVITSINCGKLVNTDFNQFFSGCKNLETCDLSKTDLSNVSSMKDIFYNCVNLSDIKFKSLPNEKSCEVNLGSCPLSETSMNKLSEIENGQCTLVFGKETMGLSNYAQCVSALESKGYSIAEPTISISGASEITKSGNTAYKTVVEPINIGTDIEWTITQKI